MNRHRARSPRNLHRLIERYTPDGAGGRLLLTIGAGFVSLFSLWMALVGVVETGVLWTIVAVLGGAIGLATGLLAVVVLWPVYLSLIGRVETTTEYRKTDEPPSTDETTEGDPIDVLKHRYATGQISEEEFDRRVDSLLDVGSKDASRADEREIDDELERFERA